MLRIHSKERSRTQTLDEHWQQPTYVSKKQVKSATSGGRRAHDKSLKLEN